MADEREQGNGTSRPVDPAGSPNTEREHRPATPVGEPDPRTIVAEVPHVSPKGRRYTIVVTNELDPYEEPVVGEKREKQGPPEGGDP
jgi:hypothetical protein